MEQAAAVAMREDHWGRQSLSSWPGFSLTRQMLGHPVQAEAPGMSPLERQGWISLTPDSFFQGKVSFLREKERVRQPIGERQCKCSPPGQLSSGVNWF